MKYLLTTFILFVSVTVFAQRQFSVVCNENESKFEVIIMGEEKSFHSVIKDGFPNQRAAQAYLNDNGPNLVCGNKNPNVPPPTTAGRSATTRTSSGTNLSTQPIKRRGYPRNVRIMGSITKFFSLDQLYVGNTYNSNQTLGYNFGAEVTFGNSVLFGGGVYYTSLFGAFEEMPLDIQFFDQDYLGALNAYKLEGVLKTPVLIKNDTWFLFEFGMSYYTDVRTSTGMDLDEFIPVLNDGFYGLRWGLGRDSRGLNFLINGELILGMTDDSFVEKETFFQLSAGLGFSF